MLPVWRNAVACIGPGSLRIASALKRCFITKSDILVRTTCTRTRVTDAPPYLEGAFSGSGKKVYLETYGCQMNFSDAAIVRAVLEHAGFSETSALTDADVVLLLTCAIRQSAEDKIWKRVKQIRRSLGKAGERVTVGILGCMANKRNLKMEETLVLPSGVDLLAGPDSYRDLPRLLATCYGGQKAANIVLSYDETYSDIRPVRRDNSAFAYISIMRGCNNMCTYCIVPFTRGRERSRQMKSIEDEFRLLCAQGIKEVTLLGQNVNSYCDNTAGYLEQSQSDYMSAGFRSISKRPVTAIRFAHLLERLASIDSHVRIRFTSPHPKDFPDEVLRVMKDHRNICKCIHLPAQSGSDAVLQRMQRGYTANSYLKLVDRIRSILPNVNLTSDFISGFCGETEEDHKQTLLLIKTVGYSYCYTFAYSMRERTKAYYRLVDDVPVDIKKQRLQEVQDAFRQIALQLNTRLIGSNQVVLVEKESKRSRNSWMGRSDGNTKVIFPKLPTANGQPNIGVGDEVVVRESDSFAVVNVSRLESMHLGQSKHFNVSMLIRTTAKEGVLLYASGVRPIRRVVSEHTFIALLIRNGHLHLVTNVGNLTNDKDFSAASEVDNGEVHLIELAYRPYMIKLSVDRHPTAVHWVHENHLKKQFIFLLDILLLGNHPRKAWPDIEYQSRVAISADKPFKGTIQDVRINDQVLNMFDEALPSDQSSFGTVSLNRILRGTQSDDTCRINPCLNNGSCIVTFNDYVCKCLDGWLRKDCSIQHPCANQVCPEGYECHLLPGTLEYACHIPATL